MDITVFLGAPGSGKGTQAKRLAESGSFKHLSTGDMLRSSIQQGSKIGLEAKAFMDKGELVPDSVMIQLIRETLSTLKSNARVILDGFPRTGAQAQALDLDEGTRVNQALYFDVPEEQLVKRLTGRRVCKSCGESYHVVLNPSKVDGTCDKCKGALYQRQDDNESVVRKRLEVFHKETRQLLDFYNQKGRLTQLNGDISIQTLQSEIVKILR